MFLNVFLRMLLLGFLMPLMVVLSHLLLSLAGFHPPWLPKWDSKRFKQSTRIKSTMNLKISKKSHQNGFPKIVQNEIASLRHFLPRRHFWGFFLADFFRAFGGLWVLLGRLLGFLEALLGGLWTQKRVKTRGFLRCLKRLFKAHDGPLGLILVSLVNLFGFFCKNPGPFWVPKVVLYVFKIAHF